MLMTSMQQEHESIILRMQQSDAILCNHLENLHFSAKKENDMFLMSSMRRALPMEVRNVNTEYAMWTQTYGTRTPSCPPLIATRGGNASGKKNGVQGVLHIESGIPLCGGYECLTAQFNDTSMQHDTKRFFDNMTKRV